MRDTVFVCGSRHWSDEDTIEAWLKVLRKSIPRLVHGECPWGADKLADSAARRLRFEVVPYPVDTEVDGPWPGAGSMRNARLLELELHRVRRAVCFVQPTGKREDLGITRGTADAFFRVLSDAKVPILVIAPGVMP